MTALRLIRGFGSDPSGATSIEYGLIAAIMALGLLVALNSTNGAVVSMYGVVVNAMTSNMP